MSAPVIVIMGAKDGVGATTVAVTMALAHQLRGHTAVVADWDATHHGDVGAAFGSQPVHTIQGVHAHIARFTPGSLLGYCQVHASGVGAVTRGERNDYVTASAVLHAVREAADLVVIDAGSRLDPVIAAAFAVATHVVCVVRPEFSVIDAARRLVAHWRQALLPSDRLLLLYNQWAERGALTPTLVAERLQVAQMMTCGAYGEAATASDHGVPLAASEPHHPFVIRVQDALDQCLRTPTAAAQPLVAVDRLWPGIALPGVARDPTAPPASVATVRRELLDALQQETDRRGIGKETSLREPTLLKALVEPIVVELMDRPEFRAPLAGIDRTTFLREVLDEAVGLGPLEPLLHDPTITEVMVNGPAQVYIERAGRVESTSIAFSSAAHVLRVIERIVAPTGRRIDESSPMVDARLPDGSRVHAVIPPLALTGPTITIRRFPERRLTMDDLLAQGALSEAMAERLAELVRTRRNILVSGGTGTGKTTLLNILSGFIAPTERIITIEDAAELQLAQPHVVRLEARPPNLEGAGAITIRDLVRNALRMRPDRIVVGECRGGEALDMLQAMNTGHDGSLTTIHANSPRDTLARLETLVLFAGLGLPARAIREQIAGAIHGIVQLERRADGKRCVVAVAKIAGIGVSGVVLENMLMQNAVGNMRQDT